MKLLKSAAVMLLSLTLTVPAVSPIQVFAVNADDSNYEDEIVLDQSDEENNSRNTDSNTQTVENDSAGAEYDLSAIESYQSSSDLLNERSDQSKEAEAQKQYPESDVSSTTNGTEPNSEKEMQKEIVDQSSDENEILLTEPDSEIFQNSDSDKSQESNLVESDRNEQITGNPEQPNDNNTGLKFETTDLKAGYFADYSLTPCIIKSCEGAGKEKVKITWEKQNNSKVYYILTWINGEYSIVGSTNSTSYLYTKARRNSDTYYVIGSSRELTDSGKIHLTTSYINDPVVQTKGENASGRCPKVKGKAIAKTTGAYISWEPSTDADGYLIYKQGYWYDELVADVKNGRCWTDTSASTEYYNNYSVEPYYLDENGNKVFGEESEWIKSIKLSANPVSSLKAEAYGRYKVKLTWNKIEGADRYVVFARRNGVIRQIGKTTNNLMVDTSAITTGNNDYWVYAVNTGITMSLNANPAHKYVNQKGILPKVSSIKSIPKADGAYISWGSSRDAQGYIIYGKRNGAKSESKLATVRGGKRCWTDTKASQSVISTYRVVPYFIDSSGKQVQGQTSSSVKAVKQSKQLVSNMKAEAYGRYKVKLTWNKVSGAKRYIVFAKRNGVIRQVGKTTNNVMIDTKAITTDNNFYWIYAVKNDYETVSVNTKDKYVWAKGNVPAVKITNSIQKYDGAYISWSQSRDAQGYLIYGMRNGSTKDVLLANVVNKRYWLDESAGSSKYSKYRIIPYFNDSKGNRVLGKASEYRTSKKKSVSAYNANELRLYKVENQMKRGILGFFENTSLGDGKAAAAILNQSYIEGTLCNGFKVNVRAGTIIGRQEDATSLSNVTRSIELIKESNQYRKKHGLPELYVNCQMMAIAAIQCNYGAPILTHTGAFSIAENLCASYYDPFDYWYTYEKKLDEKGNKEGAGHYYNLLSSSYVVTGFGSAYAQDFFGYWPVHEQAFYWSTTGIGSNAVSVDVFEKNFSNYVQKLEKEYKEARAKVS